MFTFNVMFVAIVAVAICSGMLREVMHANSAIISRGNYFLRQPLRKKYKFSILIGCLLSALIFWANLLVSFISGVGSNAGLGLHRKFPERMWQCMHESRINMCWTIHTTTETGNGVSGKLLARVCMPNRIEIWRVSQRLRAAERLFRRWDECGVRQRNRSAAISDADSIDISRPGSSANPDFGPSTDPRPSCSYHRWCFECLGTRCLNEMICKQSHFRMK